MKEKAQARRHDPWPSLGILEVFPEHMEPDQSERNGPIIPKATGPRVGAGVK